MKILWALITQYLSGGTTPKFTLNNGNIVVSNDESKTVFVLTRINDEYHDKVLLSVAHMDLLNEAKRIDVPKESKYYNDICELYIQGYVEVHKLMDGLDTLTRSEHIDIKVKTEKPKKINETTAG